MHLSSLMKSFRNSILNTPQCGKNELLFFELNQNQYVSADVSRLRRQTEGKEPWKDRSKGHWEVSGVLRAVCSERQRTGSVTGVAHDPGKKRSGKEAPAWVLDLRDSLGQA